MGVEIVVLGEGGESGWNFVWGGGIVERVGENKREVEKSGRETKTMRERERESEREREHVCASETRYRAS